ncbi:MAG: DUF1566 domain-containing protein [Actinomycetota bacterium]|nr:DUF1566 domain-containing protein [Actinomycetota bacterium]
MTGLRLIAFVMMVLVVAACDRSGNATETTTTVSSADTDVVGVDVDVSDSGMETLVEAVVAPAATYTIVDTGQQACYDADGAVSCPEEGEPFFGQDGNYTGNQAVYADNGDGTVTDLNTGLMWQQEPGEKVSHGDAVVGADSLVLAGYDDWRLPSIKELYSLIDFSGVDPSSCSTSDGCSATPFLDTDFFHFEYGDTDSGERLIDSQWATNTIYEGVTMGGDETVFGVNFADGRIKGYPLIDPRGGEKAFFVIYVRGNTGYAENDFIDTGAGTVSDLATGLIWQQDDSGEGMEWSEALGYCFSLDVGGSSDWRLPNAKELQSIVDYTRSPSTTGSAAIDPVFSVTAITDEGGNSGYGFYWSGTTHGSLMGGSAAVYLSFGEALGWMQDSRTGEYALLDVHGAGAQRSDPKTGEAADHPYGHGPQGDVIRIENLVRCVRGGVSEIETGGDVVEQADASVIRPPADMPTGGPLAEAAAMLGVTEDDLAAALGDPNSGPPDFDAAAAALGLPVEDLMEAIGPAPAESRP